ncbi:hypothetical protein QBC37DRAFT_174519 [Rhypophila decipiens]|uniref:Uncharacterized protein n=1 Tax=Rhypophila decipiens TaxID=261697 RepID=A0AAN6Y8J1_9PEZI|nr:hypothetical protein QBC37DRAFT_174519 [Rhypophila decipiens]
MFIYLLGLAFCASLFHLFYFSFSLYTFALLFFSSLHIPRFMTFFYGGNFFLLFNFVLVTHHHLRDGKLVYSEIHVIKKDTSVMERFGVFEVSTGVYLLVSFVAFRGWHSRFVDWFDVITISSLMVFISSHEAHGEDGRRLRGS